MPIWLWFSEATNPNAEQASLNLFQTPHLVLLLHLFESEESLSQDYFLKAKDVQKVYDFFLPIFGLWPILKSRTKCSSFLIEPNHCLSPNFQPVEQEKE